MTMRSPTREGAAIALAIVVALSGFAALAWPVRDDAWTAPPQAAASVAPPRATGAELNDSVSVATIVRANIFSDHRQAPPRGAVSRVGSTERLAGAESLATAAMRDSIAPARRGATMPRLFGIVASPDGPAALMRMDGAGTAATPYHVGDRSGSFRVVSIGDREVVVEGPGGRRTLRLFAPSTATKSP